MKLTRGKAILLAWVLLFQPTLSLLSKTAAKHGYSLEHQYVAQNVHHTSRGQPETLRNITAHNADPCVNGDVSLCQCGAFVVPAAFSFSFLFDPTDPANLFLSRDTLAAHKRLLIRPPHFFLNSG
ncbi:hypothetical protein [Aurantivibrio plasticivorans]